MFRKDTNRFSSIERPSIWLMGGHFIIRELDRIQLLGMGGIMMQVKRLVVSTVFGVVAGIICYLGGKYGLKDDISTAMFFYILLNRALIGFVIGISALRMHWTLHGLLIGLLAGLPFTAGCLLEANNLETAIVASILGALYGLMIEFFTSVVFGARQVDLRGHHVLLNV
jgi:hypothetical protein